MSSLGMTQEQRDFVKKNFKSLVYETEVDRLLSALVRRNVISTSAAREYQGQDKMLCKRKLFLDIQLIQGPNIFQQLLESLRESGQEHVAGILDVLPVTRGRHAIPYRMPAVDELERNLERQLSIPVHIDTNTDALIVRVVPSDRFYDNVGLPVYKTRSKHRGIAFIVNNIKFDRDEERKGAHVDGKNLKDIFQQCGMKVIYFENLKAAEIKNELEKHAENKELKLYDVTVFVFMSHGYEDVYRQSILKGTDEEPVEESWIVEQFSNRKCAALRNKPKIFLFQTCRGDRLDGRTQLDGIPSFGSPFNYDSIVSDTLIGHATLPGYKAHRDIYEGSWYIDCFCKAFMQHAHDEDVEMLLKRVDNKLKGMKSSNMTSQTPTFHNIGFKTCYLHPGIYEENGKLKRFAGNAL